MKTGIAAIALLVVLALASLSVLMNETDKEGLKLAELHERLEHSEIKGTELETVAIYKDIIKMNRSDTLMWERYINYCIEHNFRKEAIDACYELLEVDTESSFAANIIVDDLLLTKESDVYDFAKKCFEKMPENATSHVKEVYDSIKGNFHYVGDTYSEMMCFSPTGYTYGGSVNDINGTNLVSVVNAKGNRIRSSEEKPMSYTAEKNYYAALDEDGYPSYFNLDGRKINVPYDKTLKERLPYKYIGELSGGIAAVQDSNGKWGWTNASLSLFKAEFEFTSSFLNGIAYGRNAKEYTFLDTSLTPILTGSYDDVITDEYGFCSSGNVIYIKSGSKYEMYLIGKDEDGKKIITGTGKIFDDAKPFGNEYGAVKTGDKWGFIDKTGEFVIKAQFSDAYSFGSGFGAAKYNELWGFIDKEFDQKSEEDVFNKFVISPQFKETFGFNDKGVAPVNTSGNWSFIQLNEYS